MNVLVLNILFSSFFILCIKWVQNHHKTDVVTVGAINYIIAAICAIPAFLNSSPSNDVVYGYWTGSTMGICYFVAFFFLIYAVKWVGASSSAAVSRLSLVIPICVGILIWSETPNQYQTVGILFAFLSLMLVGKAKPKQAPAEPTGDPTNIDLTENDKSTAVGFDIQKTWLPFFVLGIFFLICGCSRITQQACHRLCDSNNDYPAFLLMAFTCSAIPSLVVLISRWHRIGQRISLFELFIGVLLGLSNILQSYFILRALDVFDDSVFVFTATSTGGLVLTTGIAVAFLGERLSAKNVFGIALACVSIVLLQMNVSG